MTNRTALAVLAGSALALSGCYTVLMAPASLSDEPDAIYSTSWEAPEGTQTAVVDAYADEIEPYEYEGMPYGYSPYDSGYPVAGYPVAGYDRPYDVYGFASPFAYGPAYGYGYGYGYSGYGPAYGPYGYGYDPYYSGSRGTYVPAGYELITSRELAELRDRGLGGAGGTSVPAVNQAELRRQKQRSSERAWDDRTSPTVRRSTTDYVTPKQSRPTTKSTQSRTATVSSPSSSQSSSSSSKGSGSSAAKRRKTRR